MAVDDFNRDEHPDLAVASEDGGRVGIFLGTRRRPLRRGCRRSRSGASRARWSPATSTRTASPDLAVVNFGGDAVAILQGDGQGGFAAPRLIAVGTGPTRHQRRQLRQRHQRPIWPSSIRCPTASRCCTATGAAQFPTVATFPVAARPSFLIVGDTNRDGHQDLVVGSQFSESVAILLGNGHALDAPTTNKLSGTAGPRWPRTSTATARWI